MDVVFFDTEFCSSDMSIIEFASVRYSGQSFSSLSYVSTLSFHVHHPSVIPSSTSSLTGIDNSVTSEGVFIDDASKTIDSLLSSDCILVGYGLLSDVRAFLTLTGRKVPCICRFIDLKTVCCDWMSCADMTDESGTPLGRSLSGVAENLGVRRDGRAHSALSDAKLTAECFTKLTSVIGRDRMSMYVNVIGLSDKETVKKTTLNFMNVDSFCQLQDVAHQVTGHNVLKGLCVKKLSDMLCVKDSVAIDTFNEFSVIQGINDIKDELEKGLSGSGWKLEERFSAIQECCKWLSMCKRKCKVAYDDKAANKLVEIIGTPYDLIKEYRK